MHSPFSASRIDFSVLQHNRMGWLKYVLRLSYRLSSKSSPAWRKDTTSSESGWKKLDLHLVGFGIDAAAQCLPIVAVLHSEHKSRPAVHVVRVQWTLSIVACGRSKSRKRNWCEHNRATIVCVVRHPVIEQINLEQ